MTGSNSKVNKRKLNGLKRHCHTDFAAFLVKTVLSKILAQYLRSCTKCALHTKMKIDNKRIVVERETVILSVVFMRFYQDRS